jgi:FAD-linked sulfhydryl oxidase
MSTYINDLQPQSMHLLFSGALAISMTSCRKSIEKVKSSATFLIPKTFLMPDNKPCNVCTDFRNLRKEIKKNNPQKQEIVCPPDAGELGRATWTFLHTMAAYYPAKPSDEEKESMRGFIDGLSKFYPCGYCAEHLQQDMKSTPPAVDSNTSLSKWFCDIHNNVNARQGKPKFDCSKVFERWRDGPPNSDCFPSFQ